MRIEDPETSKAWLCERNKKNVDKTVSTVLRILEKKGK